MKTMASSGNDFTMRTSAHPMKKVAVIGAGLSGLVTIKELLEESHSVICFEQEDDIGGAFNTRKKEDHGAYDDLHLTVSNYFMSFSSFPPRDEKRRYWTATEYFNYLKDFAGEFGLLDHIRFNSTVLGIDPFDEETWRITYEKNGVILDEYVDAVAICSGRFRQPNIPKFQGLERFKGQIHHSFNYKSAQEFGGKSVVCIGAGESGSDIVHQIAKVSQSAHLVINRPKHIIPRMSFGDTNDAFTTRASHYSHMVAQSHLEATLKKRIFNKRILKAKELHAFAMWKYLEKYSFHGEFSNKNDIFFQDIEHGRLKLHLFGVDHIYEDGVVLKDGTRLPCSDIMLSTGYRTQFDIIHHPAAQEAGANIRNNLFHMVHPDLRESLVWIGYVRPDVGGVPTIAELQARYFAKLLAKKLYLPRREKLVEEIERLKSVEEFYFSLEPNHAENVKYYHITSHIAEKLGVKARWYQLLSDPLLLLYYYHGSMVACHNRLVGPDSQRKQASDFIKKVGLPSTPLRFRLSNVVLASALGLMVPIYRGIVRLSGLENKSADCRGRCSSIEEILSKEWPTGRSRVVEEKSTLRSLFTREYEYEAFKFYLCEYYDVPPMQFKDLSLTVSELNEAMKTREYQLSIA